MSLRLASFAVALVGVLSFAGQVHAAAKSGPGPKTPNILFVVMDDVGIDQMETFGYGGDTPPAMPSIETVP